MYTKQKKECDALLFLGEFLGGGKIKSDVRFDYQSLTSLSL